MSVPDKIRPKVVEAINRVFDENKDLLDKLGSDYDENGVPYWEKHEERLSLEQIEYYNERLKYMEENGI